MLEVSLDPLTSFLPPPHGTYILPPTGIRAVRQSSHILDVSTLSPFHNEHFLVDFYFWLFASYHELRRKGHSMTYVFDFLTEGIWGLRDFQH